MEGQLCGKFHDSYEILAFDALEECDIYFENLKKVFYNINVWGQLFGNGINFYKVDEECKDMGEIFSRGKLVKLKIPGLKNTLGNGFDWMEIRPSELHLTLDFVSISLSLSPCRKPGTDFTTHFFKSEAQYIFIIKKYVNFITAEVHGRNEVANCTGVPLYNRVRNYITAKGGILGESKIPWHNWCKNILDVEYLEKCGLT